MEEIKALITNKLKQVEATPFLFWGSGVSKRYLNTENWEELLRKFSEEATGNEYQYELYLNEIKEEKEYGKLPQVAQLLEKDFIKKFLSDDKYNSIRETNKSIIKNGTSPLKIAIGEHFNNINIDEDNKEIKLLRKIASRKVAGIITTNYDQLTENIFEGFKTYIGQEELIFSNIYETGEIYKIHGCCSTPDSIVITEKDYENFIKKSDYLTAKLLTIFLEHPIIFMGYSIADKNIINILKSISNCLPKNKLEILKERFIFIEWCQLGQENISTHSVNFENGNRIEMTKIALNDFSILYECLLRNKSKYNPKILRRLKEDIYELVKTNNTKEKIYAIDIENIEKYDDLEIILGVGIYQNIGVQGYSRIKAEDLYEDVIFDKKDYDPDKIVKSTLPDLLMTNPGGVPIFKYLKDYDCRLFDRIEDIKNNKKNIEDFYNGTERKNKDKMRDKIQEKSIAGLITQYEKKEAYKYVLYLNKDEIEIKDLENYLKDILSNLDILKGNSVLKKLIRIYDLLKYRKSP